MNLRTESSDFPHQTLAENLIVSLKSVDRDQPPFTVLNHGERNQKSTLKSIFKIGGVFDVSIDSTMTRVYNHWIDLI